MAYPEKTIKVFIQRCRKYVNMQNMQNTLQLDPACNICTPAREFPQWHNTGIQIIYRPCWRDSSLRPVAWSSPRPLHGCHADRHGSTRKVQSAALAPSTRSRDSEKRAATRTLGDGDSEAQSAIRLRASPGEATLYRRNLKSRKRGASPPMRWKARSRRTGRCGWLRDGARRRSKAAALCAPSLPAGPHGGHGDQPVRARRPLTTGPPPCGPARLPARAGPHRLASPRERCRERSWGGARQRVSPTAPTAGRSLRATGWAPPYRGGREPARQPAPCTPARCD